MAIRQEELLVREAVVYRFPNQMIARRAAHRRMMARRRMTLGILTIVSAVTVLASLPTI